MLNISDCYEGYKLHTLSFAVVMPRLLLACILIIYPVAVYTQGSTSTAGLLKITKPTPRTINNGASIRLAPTSTTPLPSTAPTVANPSNPGISEICIHGLSLVSGDKDEAQSVKHERDFVHVIEGDVMLSVLTTDAASALFLINRINKVNLLGADFEIGESRHYIHNHTSSKGSSQTYVLQLTINGKSGKSCQHHTSIPAQVCSVPRHQVCVFST